MPQIFIISASIILLYFPKHSNFYRYFGSVRSIYQYRLTKAPHLAKTPVEIKTKTNKNNTKEDNISQNSKTSRQARPLNYIWTFKVFITVEHWWKNFLTQTFPIHATEGALINTSSNEEYTHCFGCRWKTHPMEGTPLLHSKAQYHTDLQPGLGSSMSAPLWPIKEQHIPSKTDTMTLLRAVEVAVTHWNTNNACLSNGEREL